jgi:hypothetical protein
MEEGPNFFLRDTLDDVVFHGGPYNPFQQVLGSPQRKPELPRTVLVPDVARILLFQHVDGLPPELMDHICSFLLIEKVRCETCKKIGFRELSHQVVNYYSQLCEDRGIRSVSIYCNKQCERVPAGLKWNLPEMYVGGTNTIADSLQELMYG